jgi:GT2 family glycosyltransferase
MSAVDVVVVAYNSDDHIDACLDAARRVDALGEIVVVDNNAVNRGFGRAQNLGARDVGNDFLLILNPDAEVVPAAIAIGAQLLEREPDVAAVQGAIINRATGEPERSQGRAIAPVHLVGRALGLRRLRSLRAARWLASRLPAVADHVDRVPAGPQDCESLAATALLIRRQAFDAVGGFDESYFLYGEDADLCRRLRGAGWRLVALPDTWARHTSGASATGRPERERLWWAGTMLYAAKWWSAPAFAVAIASAALAWIQLAARRPRLARPAFAEMVVAPLQTRGRR